MKIAIVGTVGVPANYGGFETLVDNIIDLDDQDNDIVVYCSSRAYSFYLKEYKNARLVYIPLRANGISSIFYDVWSIFDAVVFQKSDNILILGVSGAICLPFIRLFSCANVVTNIDGLEWKRDKWSKIVKFFLKFSEKLAVKYSDVIVADNKGIADYVSQQYKIKSEIIAYGGDHAVTSVPKQFDNDYALALCRIEPENNVELILEAFSKTNKSITFIGNWSNSEFGRSMKFRYGKYKNISMLNPIYEIDTLFDIRQKCSFYIHGHSAGGTNPSLVEMMHFGKAVFAFDCIYNRASTENKAQFFKDTTELIKLIESPADDNNALDMKEIANRRYTWKTVKRQYYDLFV
jgi:glycosyltransferase involved in cell wall biosynthesis